MTAQPATFVWCLRCARPARFYATTLDARHPLVTCSWRERDGKPHGHGLVVGTYDRAEADGKLLARQEATRARNHAALRHKDHPVRECLDCQREAGHSRHRALRITEPGCPECDAQRVQAGSAASV